ncbi:MAG: MFS transporter, partial [Afipia sp.]|nr:MFS transporter [Afipia sp.]
LIALQFTPTLLLVYIMVVVQGFLGYGFTSIMGAVVAEIFQGKHFGTIFGTIGFTALAGGAAGPWVTGILHDIYGDYTLAFIIGIAVSALSAASIWLASPGKVRAVAGRMDRIAKPA